MSNIAMNKPIDYEEKRKRKILSNGKHDVVSVYQGGPFTVVPSRALNDKRICRHPQTYLVLSVLCSCADIIQESAFRPTSISPDKHKVIKGISQKLSINSWIGDTSNDFAKAHHSIKMSNINHLSIEYYTIHWHPIMR